MRAAACAAAALAAAPAVAPNPAAKGAYKTQSTSYPVSTLDSTDPNVVVYYPTPNGNNETFPLISYTHGAAGGGDLDIIGYTELFTQIASFGFVLAATKSCSLGCSNGGGYGETYAAEQRKVIDWARAMAASPGENMPWAAALDFAHGVGIAGHSMGGQSTAINARKEFGPGTKYDIRAAVLHMAATDAAAGKAIAIPSSHFSGSKDGCDHRYEIYEGAPTPKVFRCQTGEAHTEPVLNRPSKNPALGPYAAAWFKIYLLGDTGKYHDMIYGNGDTDLCYYAPMDKCELDEK